jgi:hypothetical protein
VLQNWGTTAPPVPAGWINEQPDGLIGQANLNGVLQNWGNTSAVAAAVAVPEPSSVQLAMLLLVTLGLSRLGLSHLRRKNLMKFVPAIGVVLLTLFSGLSMRSAHAVIPPPTLDRDYGFGNDDPGAVAGGIVGANDPFGQNRTRDGIGQPLTNQLIDIKAVGSGGFPLPRYETVTDRPDGVNGNLGIRLNQNSFDRQSLQSGRDEALNFPELSASSTSSVTTPPGIIDYSFITDRYFQLWVKPSDRTGYEVEDQHIVMDTNNHGVMINAAGKFSMRYSYNLAAPVPESNIVDFEGVTSPVVETWYHLMVGRPFGPGRTGSVLYVNGVAEAAVNGKYIGEDVPNDEANESIIVHDRLVVGANTSPGGVDGVDNFFSGLVDDLEMSLMGLNNAGDYGEFQFERDNSFAAFFKPTTDGDLNGDDDVDPADVVIFSDNWLSENIVGGLLVGDLSSRDVGDFNYDGRVDLGDWNILNDANPAMAALAMSMIQSVPEPTALALMALVMMGAVSTRNRRHQ